jgi:hypothetical protein
VGHGKGFVAGLLQENLAADCVGADSLAGALKGNLGAAAVLKGFDRKLEGYLSLGLGVGVDIGNVG